MPRRCVAQNVGSLATLPVMEGPNCFETGDEKDGKRWRFLGGKMVFFGGVTSRKRNGSDVM